MGPSSNTPDTVTPLYSDYADDPDMGELVEMFVADLPQRTKDLNEAVANADAAQLARLTHQLKGSAGGYGFMPITESAAVAETLAKTGEDMDALSGAVGELVSLCKRAMASI